MTGKEVIAQCCVLIGPSVGVAEPATGTITAVGVTFNTDYVVNGTTQLGLSVNGRPCSFYGTTVTLADLRTWK